MKKFSYRKWLRRSLRDALIVSAAYLLISYLLLPALWRHYEREPSLETAPKTTESAADLPGDPLNVALVGKKEEVVRALLMAGWQPADRITLRTSLSMAGSFLLRRSYPTAPMSRLYVWGRVQDLAFERQTSATPAQRHHVRLWESELRSRDGRPLWVGAATYDRGIGFNRFTGQLTHHIAPDIDAERDALLADLVRVRQVAEISQVTGVGPNIAARNAQGDWYYTDGEMTVGVLAPDNAFQTRPPAVIKNPPAVTWKNEGWAFLRQILASMNP